MRIWSLHPRLLDAEALRLQWVDVATIRQDLKRRERDRALGVPPLQYGNHPHAKRFQSVTQLDALMHSTCDYTSHGRAWLGPREVIDPIVITPGQARYELWLLGFLERGAVWLGDIEGQPHHRWLHPLIRVEGCSLDVCSWEQTMPEWRAAS